MNHLYDELADYYDIISHDRDFVKECDAIHKYVNHGSEQMSVLELFAGPAYHGAEWKKRGANIVCIDASSQMKEMACDHHNVQKSEYIVGALPNAMDEIDRDQQFDLVTVLRFSLGLIPPIQMEELLKRVHKILLPGGIFALELHRLDFLTANLDELTIRSRSFPTRDNKGIIHCEWPSAPIKWSVNELKVQMPVHVTIEEGDKKIEKETVSTENIYLLEHFEQFIRYFGGYTILEDSYDSVEPFNESKLILLRKESE